MRIDDDVFLSDRTVASDDPRIIEMLKNLTKIRNRSGFDPMLIKNKMWANKLCKDLIQGLTKVDEIGIEKRRRETLLLRNIEAQRFILNRRLNQMSKQLVSTGHHRERANSVDYSKLCLDSAYKDLHRSVNNLKDFTNELESRGGFFKMNSQVEDDYSRETNNTGPALKTEAISHTITDLEDMKEPKIFCVHRHLITQPSTIGCLYRVRSPSLPSIKVTQSVLKVRNFSYPDDLSLVMHEEN